MQCPHVTMAKRKARVNFPIGRGKLANKRYNKLVKRGKIHPGIAYKHGAHDPSEKKKEEEEKNVSGTKNTSDTDEFPEPDVTDMFEEDDLENLKKSFLNKSDNLRSLRKRKTISNESSDDSEENYERNPRDNFGARKKIRHLLPLKGKDGLIHRMHVMEDNEVEADESEEQAIKGKENVKENGIIAAAPSPVSFIEKYAQRKKIIDSKKVSIATLSFKILENPEENTKSLKELIYILIDKSSYLTVKKLSALSLLEVFCDILPGYRIRMPTEKEQEQKLKKETRKLRDYELTLLRNYKRYLQFLETMCNGMETKITEGTKYKLACSIGVVAVKCFCQLLVTHPHFNYRSNIIHIIIPFMAHKNKEISEICFNAVVKLYKEDKLGEVSLEVVKETSKLLKQRNYNVPVPVLKTFLFLNVHELSTKNEEMKKKDMKKIREQLKMMSRKEKRRKKKMKRLEQELLETEAEESKNKKEKIHLEIVHNLFSTYFRIIKNSTKSDLITPVLEGVSKYAHLINVEFFDDLIVVLHKLMDSGTLSNYETLHCLHTVFTVLSGEGEALNIDPQKFYCSMYKLLVKFDITASPIDVETLLACLEIMITKRKKKLTSQRVLAFIKRLCTVALQMSHGSALGIMTFVRMMLMNYKFSDILLDVENSFGSGVYLPELEDPEHCNAHASALWELHELHRHYHPVVAKYADHLLKGCPLQGDGQLLVEFSRKSPQELFAEYDENVMNPEMLLSQQQNVNKVNTRRKLHPCVCNPDSLLSQSVNIVNSLK